MNIRKMSSCVFHPVRDGSLGRRRRLHSSFLHPVGDASLRDAVFRVTLVSTGRCNPDGLRWDALRIVIIMYFFSVMNDANCLFDTQPKKIMSKFQLFGRINDFCSMKTKDTDKNNLVPYDLFRIANPNGWQAFRLGIDLKEMPAKFKYEKAK
jgi:hypothetical protein